MEVSRAALSEPFFWIIKSGYDKQARASTSLPMDKV
jgi:hypothetical protein